jgi:hypothetical protein
MSTVRRWWVDLYSSKHIAYTSDSRSVRGLTYMGLGRTETYNNDCNLVLL